jgi:hypothetical protein
MAKSQAQLIAEGSYEYCCVCGNPTGKAGKGDASHYCEECCDGPFCDVCFERHCAEEAALDARIRAEAEEDEAWHLDEAREYWVGRKSHG